MATVIIDVSLNAQDANARAAEVGNSIKAIREEQKELKASTEETGVAFQSNAVQLRQLQQEQRAYIAIAQAADGSNNQLRAQLALLTQQYNALGKEERDGTVAGQSLAIQIRGISDELKKNESAVGDNRRNVGNYKDALTQSTDAAKNATQGQKNLLNAVSQSTIGFQFGGDAINSVTSQVQAFRQATQEAREAQQAYQAAQQISVEATEAASAATERATQIGFQFTAGQATEAQVIAANTAATDANIVATEAQAVATEASTVATTAATNAAKIFKVALASTGIGAIVILIVALLSYLKEFDPLVDLIEQLFAGFKAGFDTVGRLITDFISNIKSMGDLLSKLGKFFLDPVGSIKSFSKEVGNAAKAAYNLKAAQQDLEDQMSVQEVINARAEQQIKQLILQSKNRTISEQERQKFLKQANDLEVKTFNQRTVLVDKDVANAQEAARIKGNLSAQEIARLKNEGTAYAIELQNRGRIGQTEVDLVKKTELDKVKNLDESTQQQEKIQNRLELSQQKAEEAAQKRAEKAKEMAEKARAAEEVRLESVVKTNESIQTERKNEEDNVNRDIDAKILKYKEYSSVTQQLELERTARLKDIQKQYALEIAKSTDDVLRATEDLFISRIQNQQDRELATIAVQNQRKLAAQDELLAQTYERIQLGEEGLTGLYVSQQALRDEILTQGQFDIDQKNKEYEDQKAQETIDRNQRVLDAKIKIQDEERKLTDAGLDLLEQVFGKETALGKTAFLAQKAFAVARIIIDTQAALAANRLAEQVANASLSAIPVIGIGLAIANSVKAQAERTKIIIGGAISAGAVLATAVAGFNDGVIGFSSDGKGSMVRGKGTSKSDSINARLSNGESVINARSTSMFAPLLSAINEAGGGRALSPGFAMASGGIAQGGFVTRIDQGIQSTNDTINLVLQAVNAMPRPVVGVEQIVDGLQIRQVTVQNQTI